MRRRPNYERALVFAATYLLLSLSLLMLFPPSNWPGGRWPRLENFVQTWTLAPTWDDGDPWFTNYVGHPLMGLVLYSFARHNGHGIARSVVFTLVASTSWEFALEGWFERPSYVDLWVTPTLGPMLGELRWQVRGRLLARRATLGWWGRALLRALAPLERSDEPPQDSELS